MAWKPTARMWSAVKARCADPEMTSCISFLLPTRRILAIMTAYVACSQIKESLSCGAAFGVLCHTLTIQKFCKT